MRPLTVVIGLIALQAVIGGVQWALELPALLVWVHIAVATTTWLAMLWTVAVAGRLEPRPEPAASRSGERKPERQPLGSSA
jgi:cytochrome c oxidase assembly protein subunit 15